MSASQVSSGSLGVHQPMRNKAPESLVALNRSVDEHRILLADEHAIFRDALRALLQISRFEVVGVAWDSEMVLRLAIEQNPDILLLDWSLARRDGMAVLKKIAASGVAIRTLLYSVVIEPKELLEALRLGVSGV